MKFLSDNLLVLALALILGISPLQSISASVSKCINMDQSMQHQMNTSDKAAQHVISHPKMSNPANQDDCCEQNTCDMSHCAGSSIAALITSNTKNDMTYTVGNVYIKPAVSLIPFYPSSLYRPPRV